MNKTTMVNTTKKERNSSFELLRIIAMLFIIAHHFYVHGNFSSLSQGNNIAMLFFEFGGKFGVILFMLIAGYFGVKGKFKLTKLLKLLFQVFFYSVSIYFICLIVGNVKISFVETIKTFLPTFFAQYWFVFYYILTYILSPFINKLLLSASKAQLKGLLISSFALYIFVKLLSGITFKLFIFIFVYILGAYFKLHPIKFLKKKWQLSIIIALLYILIIILKYFTNINTFANDNLLLIALACFVFLLFEQFHFYSKAVNFIAKTTFGIYLIHDNKHLSPIIWEKIFKVNTFGNNNLLFLVGIGIVICVFVVCSLIEIARIYSIERPFNKFLNKLKNKYKKFE